MKTVEIGGILHWEHSDGTRLPVMAGGGTTPQADIPAAFYTEVVGPLASRASNAADGVVPLHIMKQAGSLLSASLMPTASQPGSATNFAQIKIIDLGTDGTGTRVLASTNALSAAGGSVAAAASANIPSVAASIAAGRVIGVSYASAGNGIALVEHKIQLDYNLA